MIENLSLLIVNIERKNDVRFLGINVKDVQSLSEIKNIIELKSDNLATLGMVKLMDEILPLYDIKKLILNENINIKNNPIMVNIKTLNNKAILLFEKVEKIIDIKKHHIQFLEHPFIDGVIEIDKQMVQILNLDKLIDVNFSRDKSLTL